MPADPFAQRLDLLEQSLQLSAEVRSRLEKLMERVEDEFVLELNEDNAAMFVTHVAMAWTKLAQGIDLPPAPNGMLAEIEPYAHERQFLSDAFSSLAAPGEELSEDELAFWTAHLVAIRQAS